MADWLGLKITPNQLKLWERERAEGKWNFIFKRGLSIGLYCAVLAPLMYWFDTPMRLRTLHNLVAQDLILIILSLTGGMIWGMSTWRVLEKRYFGRSAT